MISKSYTNTGWRWVLLQVFSYNAGSYPDPRLLLLIVSINNKLITEVGDLFTSPEFLRFIFRCRDVPTKRL
jgi:hypothetical protein